MRLNVYFLPNLVVPEELAGQTVVVIDVLRATTTILHALSAGAREVIPCLEVEEARRRAADLRGNCVLGGERGGERIPGFDLGNSPTEYVSSVVAGKTVIFTTTNGTRALQTCRAAARVLVAGFVNLSVLTEELRGSNDIAIVCAGTDQLITREDVLLAGALAANLRSSDSAQRALNDEAEIAAAAWQKLAGNLRQPEELQGALRASRGGRNLIVLGYDRDISTASRIDAVPLLAELVLDQWRIVAISRQHC